MATSDPTAPYGAELKETVAERIRAARLMAGKPGSRTVAHAMRRLLGQPWSHNMILEIEKGHRDVTVRELRALADVLEQDYRWLAGDDNVAPVVHLRSSAANVTKGVSLLLAA